MLPLVLRRKKRKIEGSEPIQSLLAEICASPTAPSATSEEQDKHAMAEDGEWVVVNNGDVMEDLLDGTECEVCAGV